MIIIISHLHYSIVYAVRFNYNTKSNRKQNSSGNGKLPVKRNFFRYERSNVFNKNNYKVINQHNDEAKLMWPYVLGHVYLYLLPTGLCAPSHSE